MDVKEVIEFLKEWNKLKPYRNSAMNITQLNKTMDSVIDLLQQGEKYRQLVGELENCLLPEQWEVVEILMKKYFLKEAKQDEAEDNRK